MNKKGAKIILEHVLAKSSHQTLKTFESLGFKTANPFNRVSDEKYLDTNLSKIYCDFLLEDSFSILPKKSTNFLHHAKQLGVLFPQRLACDIKPMEIEGKLIQMAKKLEELKNSDEVYNKAEDLIYSMTADEAAENKDYLMHLYKWVLNQKGRINQEMSQNCESLKNAVVKKLCDAYTRGEMNQEIEDELCRLQVLAKAREFSMNGESQKAMIAYESVFKNPKNNDTTRMEALEYLCRYSQKRGDKTYLKSIIESLAEKKGEERHRKYVERALSQLSERAEAKMTSKSQHK